MAVIDPVDGAPPLPRAPRRHSAPAFLFHSHLSSIFNRCPQWVYRGPMAHSLGIPILSRPRRHSATPVSVPFMVLLANHPAPCDFRNRSTISIDPPHQSIHRINRSIVLLRNRTILLLLNRSIVLLPNRFIALPFHTVWPI